ncbi:MAG: L-lactate permease, partial [Syntrophobacteraceae bacterium]
LRFWKPSRVFHFPDEKPSGPVTCQYTSAEIVRAWTPYLILAVMVFLWGLDSIKALLAPLGYSFAWPGLHNLVVKTAPIVANATPYAATYTLNIGSAAGTAILISGILSILIIPKYGFGRAISCYARTSKQLRFPIVTIAMILGLAYIMNYSGMSSSMGLALATTGVLFPFFSPILGWLGVFLTGSDTSSNALFGALQKTTATQLGIDPALTVAANSSGGVCGKMISPQSISVATAASGLVGQEGNIFRFTLGHSIAMVLFLSVLTFLQAYVLKWMLP